jgi:hypothetical protein
MELTPMMHLFTLVSATAAGALVAAVWQGVVLAVCVGLGLWLMPRMSAAARSIIWLAVMVLVVLLPLLHGFAGTAGAGRVQPYRVGLIWSAALGCVWGVLSLVRAAQLVHSAIHLRGVARRAELVTPDAAIAAILGRAGRTAVLRTSTEVDRPSVIGFFSPSILLPPELYTRLSAAELEQVVLHEMEHLRRGDDWTNLLQKICLALFPLNPVLLWVERRLCLERELACDDNVLRSTGAPKAYATCLANLAEHRLLRRGVSLALGAWERQPELARRVHRILRRPETALRPAQAGLALSVLLLGLVGGAAGLAHAPQLVSFGAEPESGREAALADSASARQDAALGDSQVRAMMVKAVMPAPQPTGPRVAPARVRAVPSVSKPKRREAGAAVVRRVAESRPGTWYVLTGWEQVSDEAPRTALIVTQTRIGEEAVRPRHPQVSYSYAAVSTGNGWLVFQL